MSEDKATPRSEAFGWFERADHDLRAVRVCLAASDFLPDIAAYHCQQAAEKLIKGVLVLAGVSFRKTHDLDELADLAAAHFPSLALRQIPLWLRDHSNRASMSRAPCRTRSITTLSSLTE